MGIIKYYGCIYQQQDKKNIRYAPKVKEITKNHIIETNVMYGQLG